MKHALFTIALFLISYGCDATPTAPAPDPQTVGLELTNVYESSDFDEVGRSQPCPGGGTITHTMQGFIDVNLRTEFLACGTGAFTFTGYIVLALDLEQVVTTGTVNWVHRASRHTGSCSVNLTYNIVNDSLTGTLCGVPIGQLII